jgi:hypothetical protein
MVTVQKLIESQIVANDADGGCHRIIQRLALPSIHVGPSDKKLMKGDIIELRPSHRHFNSSSRLAPCNQVPHLIENFNSTWNAGHSVVDTDGDVHGVTRLCNSHAQTT